jgi:hypothetical protein
MRLVNNDGDEMEIGKKMKKRKRTRAMAYVDLEPFACLARNIKE